MLHVLQYLLLREIRKGVTVASMDVTFRLVGLQHQAAVHRVRLLHSKEAKVYAILLLQCLYDHREIENPNVGIGDAVYSVTEIVCRVPVRL